MVVVLGLRSSQQASWMPQQPAQASAAMPPQALQLQGHPAQHQRRQQRAASRARGGHRQQQQRRSPLPLLLLLLKAMRLCRWGRWPPSSSRRWPSLCRAGMLTGLCQQPLAMQVRSRYNFPVSCLADWRSQCVHSAAHGVPELQHAPLCGRRPAALAARSSMWHTAQGSHHASTMQAARGWVCRYAANMLCMHLQLNRRLPYSHAEQPAPCGTDEAEMGAASRSTEPACLKAVCVCSPLHAEPGVFHTAGGAEAGLASRMACLHADQRLRMLTQEFCAAGGAEAGVESKISSGSSRLSQDPLASAASADLSSGTGRFRVPDSEGPAAVVRLNSGKGSAWISPRASWLACLRLHLTIRLWQICSMQASLCPRRMHVHLLYGIMPAACR